MNQKPNKNIDDEDVFCLFSHEETSNGKKANQGDAPPISSNLNKKIFTNNPNDKETHFSNNNVPSNQSMFPNESLVKSQGMNNSSQNPYIETLQLQTNQIEQSKLQVPQPQPMNNCNNAPNWNCSIQNPSNNNNAYQEQPYTSGGFKFNNSLECGYVGLSTQNLQMKNNTSPNIDIHNFQCSNNKISYQPNNINNNYISYCSYCNGSGFIQFNKSCSCQYNSYRGGYQNQYNINRFNQQYYC